MNIKAVIELFKDTFKDWSEDKAPRLGAALAYYTTFSIAPLLIVVLSIAGLFFGQEAASGRMDEQIEGLVGRQAADEIQTIIQNANQRQKSTNILTTVVGIATLLLGASGVFGQLQDALNTIWEVQPKPGQGLLATLKSRFLSFAMVLGTGFLLLTSLALSAALAALGDYMQGQFAGIPEGLLQGINFIVSFGVITLLFAMIFKVLPDVEIQWRDVWIGAAVTALLFVIGKFALGLYLGKGDVGSAYGAAGSLVIILLWVYYAAQILFFGAEFTQVYAKKYGSRIVPSPNAVPLTAEARATQGIPHDEHVDAAMKGNALPGDPVRAPAPRPNGAAAGMASTSRPSHEPDYDFLIPAAIGFAAVLYFGSRLNSTK